MISKTDLQAARDELPKVLETVWPFSTQLGFPTYCRRIYETMSALLDEIIAARKSKAIEYEAYLKRIAELATKVQAGQAADTPKTLNTPGRRALYNNLGRNEALALAVDEAVKRDRPDSWRGVQAREQVIKAALFKVLQDINEVERVFLIIMQQTEY